MVIPNGTRVRITDTGQSWYSWKDSFKTLGFKDTTDNSRHKNGDEGTIINSIENTQYDGYAYRVDLDNGLQALMASPGMKIISPMINNSYELV